MMKKRTLGRTNIKVSPIGIGVMMWMGGDKGLWRRMPYISSEDKKTMIKASFDGGVNFFDTAEAYGFGRSEVSLVKALKANNIADKDVVIGTKWMPMMRWARNMRRNIMKRIEYLSGYTIDLYMVHFPISFSGIKAQMNEMARLVKDDKIRSVGVSNFSAKQMRKAHEVLEKQNIPLAVNQVNYSLLRRNIERNGILDTAKELGITIVAYTPLGQGLLTGKYHSNPKLIENKTFFMQRSVRRKLDECEPLVQTLTEIGKAHKATPAQVALNWLVSYGGDTVITIPGATKVGHVEESAGAMTFTLSKAELAEIAEDSEKYL
ncbi:MAG: aldo/keto reductase [Asgard group archaeon]|nr:aldo/keto reductase [Asgard group archaeon]